MKQRKLRHQRVTLLGKVRTPVEIAVLITLMFFLFAGLQNVAVLTGFSIAEETFGLPTQPQETPQESEAPEESLGLPGEPEEEPSSSEDEELLGLPPSPPNSGSGSSAEEESIGLPVLENESATVEEGEELFDLPLSLDVPFREELFGIQTAPSASVVVNATTINNVTGDDLVAYVTDIEDIDNDVITLVYSWFVDGIPFANLNAPFEHHNSHAIGQTKDYSGYDNHGQIGNTSIGDWQEPKWLATGEGAGGYYFTGNDYIDFYNPGTGRPTFPFTVVARVNFTNFDDSNIILSSSDIGDNGIYSGWSVYTGTGQKITGGIGDNAGNCGAGNRKTFVSDTALSTDTWYHVAVVFNSISDFDIYLDGVEDTTTNTGSASAMAYDSNNRLRSGVSWDPCSTETDFAEFTVSELMLFDRALSADQIAFLNASTDPFSADWNMSQIDSAETVTDEIWRIEVTPNDGFADGITTSDEIKILGTNAPSLPEVVLNATFSANKNNSDNLTAYPMNPYAPSDGVIITFIDQWYVNGRPYAILNLPFDHAASGGTNTTKDYSGNRSDGQLGSSADGDGAEPSWGANFGQIRGGYSFTTNDYIQIAEPVVNEPPYSVEIWARADDATPVESKYAISNGGHTTGSYGFAILIQTDGNYEWIVRSKDTGLGASINDVEVAATTDWTHLVGTWNGTGTNSMKLYVDGVLAAEATPSAQTTGAADNLRIGAPSNQLTNEWEGALDEIRIYDRVLTPEQVFQRYNDTKNGEHNLSTVRDTETELHEVWNVVITSNDGTADSEPTWSNDIVILNANNDDPPASPNATLQFPADEATLDTLDITFACSVADETGINDVSLYTNRNGTFAEYETLKPHIFYDDFENSTVNTNLPAGWTEPDIGTGNGAECGYSLSDVTSVSKDLSFYVHSTNNQPSNCNISRTLDIPLVNDFNLSMDLYVIDTESNVPFLITYDDSGVIDNKAAGLYFGTTNSNWGWNDNTSWVDSDDPIALKTWQHVELVVEMGNKTFDLYVDGVQLAEDAQFRGTVDNIAELRIGNLETFDDAALFYDNIKITNVTESFDAIFTVPSQADQSTSWNCKVRDIENNEGWGASNFTFNVSLPDIVLSQVFEKGGVLPTNPTQFDSEASTRDRNSTNKTDDSARWVTELTGIGGKYETQLFRFNLTKNFSTLDNLDVNWEGYGENRTGYPTNLSIYNWSGSNWYELSGWDFTSNTDLNLTGNISSSSFNISNFVENNSVVVRAYTKNAFIPNIDPVIKGEYKESGGGISAHNLNQLYEVRVVDDYAYTSACAGDSFTIFDISNPRHPVVMGSHIDSAGVGSIDCAIDFTIVDEVAYVLSDVDDYLTILNISNKTGPTVLGAGYTDTAPAGSIENPRGIYVHRRDAPNDVIAFITSTTDDSITVLNVTDPSNIVLLDDWTDTVPAYSVEEAKEIVGRGIYGGEDGSEELISIYSGSFIDNDVSVWNATNVIDLTAEADAGVGDAGPYEFFVLGDILYVGFNTDDSLIMYNVTEPVNLNFAKIGNGYSDTAAPNSIEDPRGLYVVNTTDNQRYAFMGSTVDDCITIINVTDQPTNPAAIGDICVSDVAEVRGIHVAGDYIYAAVPADHTFSILETNQISSLSTDFVGISFSGTVCSNPITSIRDGDWNNNDTWADRCYPYAGTNVTVNNNVSVVTTGALADNVQISGTGHLNFLTNETTDANFTGNVTVGSASDHTPTLSGGANNVWYGTLQSYGVTELSSANTTLFNLPNQGSGLSVMTTGSGSILKHSGGTLIVNGTFEGSSYPNIARIGFGTSAVGTEGLNNFIADSPGSIVVALWGPNSIDANLAGNLTIVSGANLTTVAPSTSNPEVLKVNGSTIVEGNLNLGYGDGDVANASFGSIEVRSGGSINESWGHMNVSGNFRNAGTFIRQGGIVRFTDHAYVEGINWTNRFYDLEIDPGFNVTTLPGENLSADNRVNVEGQLDIHQSGLTFEGNQYVELGSDESLILSPNGSIEAWFKIDNLAASYGNTIIMKGDGASWANIHYSLFEVTGTDKIYLTISDSATSIQATGPKTPSLEEDRWYFIAATWDGDIKCVYLDGVRSECVTTAIDPANTMANEAVNIGRTYADNYYFDGDIDNVRFYNTTLNATQVQEHYNNKFVNESELVGRYDFDDSVMPHTTGDWSIQGNNATLGSATEGDAQEPDWFGGNTTFDSVQVFSTGTLNASSYNMTLKGKHSGTNNAIDVDAGGVFIHNNGTVILTGAGAYTDNVDGTSAFWDLIFKADNNMYAGINVDHHFIMDASGKTSFFRSGNLAAGNVTINQGQFEQYLAAAQTITATGDIIVNNTGNLSLVNGGTQTFGSLTVNSGGQYNATPGITTISGDFNISGSVYGNNGTVAALDQGLAIESGGSVADISTLNITSIHNSGILNVSAGGTIYFKDVVGAGFDGGSGGSDGDLNVLGNATDRVTFTTAATGNPTNEWGFQHGMNVRMNYTDVIYHVNFRDAFAGGSVRLQNVIFNHSSSHAIWFSTNVVHNLYNVTIDDAGSIGLAYSANQGGDVDNITVISSASNSIYSANRYVYLTNSTFDTSRTTMEASGFLSSEGHGRGIKGWDDQYLIILAPGDTVSKSEFTQYEFNARNNVTVMSDDGTATTFSIDEAANAGYLNVTSGVTASNTAGNAVTVTNDVDVLGTLDLSADNTDHDFGSLYIRDVGLYSGSIGITNITNGNWTNDGSFTHNAGAIAFGGGTGENQSITGNNETHFFSVNVTNQANDLIQFQNTTVAGVLDIASDSGYALDATERNIHLNFGNDSGGDAKLINSGTFVFSGTVDNHAKIASRNTSHEAVFVGTDLDWDSRGSGSVVNISGIDYQINAVTGGDGVTVIIEDNSSIDAWTITAGDSLNVTNPITITGPGSSGSILYPYGTLISQPTTGMTTWYNHYLISVTGAILEINSSNFTTTCSSCNALQSNAASGVKANISNSIFSSTNANGRGYYSAGAQDMNFTNVTFYGGADSAWTNMDIVLYGAGDILLTNSTFATVGYRDSTTGWLLSKNHNKVDRNWTIIGSITSTSTTPAGYNATSWTSSDEIHLRPAEDYSDSFITSLNASANLTAGNFFIGDNSALNSGDYNITLGALTVESGGTYNATTANTKVTGWTSLSGTFNANTGNLSLRSGAEQVAGLTVSGGTFVGGSGGNHTFGNLILTGSPTVTLTTGTTTLDGRNGAATGNYSVIANYAGTKDLSQGTIKLTTTLDNTIYTTGQLTLGTLEKAGDSVTQLSSNNVYNVIIDSLVVSGGSLAAFGNTLQNPNLQITDANISSVFSGGFVPIQIGTITINDGGTYNATNNITNITNGNFVNRGNFTSNEGTIEFQDNAYLIGTNESNPLYKLNVTSGVNVTILATENFTAKDGVEVLGHLNLHQSGLYFGDGTGDYVDTPDLNIDGNINVTIEAWARLRPSHSDCSDIEAIFTSASSAQNGLSIVGSDCDSVIFKGESSADGDGITVSGIGIHTHAWNHYVALSNDTGLFIYINGEHVGSNTGSFVSINITDDIEVGHASGSGSRFFNGWIDNFRLYNRSLSETEIREHYANNFVNDSGLVLRYDFEESNGSLAGDWSGNGNDGVLGTTVVGDAAEPVTVYPNVSLGGTEIRGGTFNATSGTTSLTKASSGGRAIRLNSGSFTHNKGTVNITASNSGAITSINDPDNDFYNLNIEAGTSNQFNSLNVENDLNISGTLADNGNQLLNVSGRLTVYDGGVLSARTTNYQQFYFGDIDIRDGGKYQTGSTTIHIMNLTRNSSIGGNFTLFNATIFNLRLNGTLFNISNGSSVQVSDVNNIYSSPLTASALGKYVNITNTSSPASATINISYSDALPADEDELKLYKHDGTVWTLEVDIIKDTTNNKVNKNLTSFSLFGLFENSITTCASTIYSVAHGDWNNNDTWAGPCFPFAGKDTIIGHNVSVVSESGVGRQENVTRIGIDDYGALELDFNESSSFTTTSNFTINNGGFVSFGNQNFTLASLYANAGGMVNGSTGMINITSHVSNWGWQTIGNFTPNGGYVEIGGTTASQHVRAYSGATFYDLKINKPSGILYTRGNLQVDHDFWLTGAPTFRRFNSNDNYSFLGTVTLDGGTLIGSADGHTGFPSHRFGNLTINSGGTYNATEGVTIVDDFTDISGDLNATTSGPLILGHDESSGTYAVQINSGGVLHAGESNHSYGNVHLRGGGTWIATNETTTITSRQSGGASLRFLDGSTFTHSSGTVRINQTSGAALFELRAEDAGGTGGPTFYDLDHDSTQRFTLYNVAGDTGDAPTVTVENDLTITRGTWDSRSGTANDVNLTVLGDTNITGTLHGEEASLQFKNLWVSADGTYNATTKITEINNGVINLDPSGTFTANGGAVVTVGNVTIVSDSNNPFNNLNISAGSNVTLIGSVDVNDETYIGGELNARHTYLTFDGSDDYIDITGLDVDTAAEAYNTVEAWIYSDNFDGNMPFGFTSYDLYDSTSCFGFNTAAGDVYGVIDTELEGRWIHLVAIFYNGQVSAANNELYVDGQKLNIYQCLGTSGDRDVVSTLRVSGWNNGAGYNWDGDIDNLRIYNRSLNATEITEHYNHIYLNESGLVGHWPFDENNGSITVDTEYESNNGTLGNSSIPDIYEPTWTTADFQTGGLTILATGIYNATEGNTNITGETNTNFRIDNDVGSVFNPNKGTISTPSTAATYLSRNNLTFNNLFGGGGSLVIQTGNTGDKYVVEGDLKVTQNTLYVDTADLEVLGNTTVESGYTLLVTNLATNVTLEGDVYVYGTIQAGTGISAGNPAPTQITFGTLYIKPGGTYNATLNTTLLKGNYRNEGTLIHNNGTIEFIDNAYIIGVNASQPFWDLNISHGANVTILVDNFTAADDVIIHDGTFSTKQGGLSFDGSDDRVWVGDPSSDVLDFGINDFTLEAWYYLPSTVSDWEPIINKGASGSDGYGIEISSNNLVVCSIDSQGGTNQHVYGPAPKYSQWQHVICVFDRDDQIYQYVDGAFTLKNNYLSGNGDLSVDTSYELKLGMRGSPWNWPGLIGDVRIYNRTLNFTEVQEHYNGIYRNESDLVGHWPLDDGYNQNVTDISGYENHGYLGTSATEDSADPNWLPSYTNITRLTINVNGTYNATPAVTNITGGGTLESYGTFNHNNGTVEFGANGTILIVNDSSPAGNLLIPEGSHVSTFSNDPIAFEGNVTVLGKLNARDGGLTFDGTNDHLQLSNAPLLTNSTTFALWMKLDENIGTGAHTLYPGIAAAGTNAWDNYISFYNNSGDNYIWYEDVDGASKGLGPFTYTTGDWIHVVITMDAVRVPNLFIDGAHYSATAVSPSNYINITYIGYGYSGATNDGAFNGTIADVRIYNKTLNDAEARLLYEHKFTDESNLVTHLKFDEGDGHVAGDSSGNGTANGATLGSSVEGDTAEPTWTDSNFTLGNIFVEPTGTYNATSAITLFTNPNINSSAIGNFTILSGEVRNAFFNGTLFNLSHVDDVYIRNVITTPARPGGEFGVGEYVNLTNASAESTAYLNLSYPASAVDVLGADEAGLSIWDWNGTLWSESGTSAVDTTNNYLYDNITSFSLYSGFSDTKGVSLVVWDSEDDGETQTLSSDPLITPNEVVRFYANYTSGAETLGFLEARTSDVGTIYAVATVDKDSDNQLDEFTVSEAGDQFWFDELGTQIDSSGDPVGAGYSVTAFDADLDGFSDEIVISDSSGYIQVYDENGDEIWSVGDFGSSYDIVVADLDDDGVAREFFVSRHDGASYGVIAYNTTNGSTWEEMWSDTTAASVGYEVEFSEITGGNATPNNLVATTEYTGGGIIVYNAMNGTIHADTGDYGTAYAFTFVDLDGDGERDEYALAEYNEVYMFNNDGTLNYTATEPVDYIWDIVDYDWDGDGIRNEVIAADRGYIWVIDETGTVVDSWAEPDTIYRPDPGRVFAMNISDIDNDGEDEIVWASGEDGFTLWILNTSLGVEAYHTSLESEFRDINNYWGMSIGSASGIAFASTDSNGDNQTGAYITEVYGPTDKIQNVRCEIRFDDTGAVGYMVWNQTNSLWVYERTFDDNQFDKDTRDSNEVNWEVTCYKADYELGLSGTKNVTIYLSNTSLTSFDQESDSESEVGGLGFAADTFVDINEVTYFFANYTDDDRNDSTTEVSLVNITGLIDAGHDQDSIVWADLDRDGVRDELVVGENGEIRSYNSDGTLRNTDTSLVGIVYGIAVGDFDNDTYYDDVVVSDSSGYIRVYNETMQLEWATSDIGNGYDIAVFDFDNDSVKNDFIFTEYTGGSYAISVYNSTDGLDWTLNWTDSTTSSVPYEVDVDQNPGELARFLIADLNGFARGFWSNGTSICATADVGNTVSARWADLDNDGVKDEIAMGERYETRTFDETCTADWTSTAPFEYQYETEILDLDDDGFEDDVITASLGRIDAWDESGTLLWTNFEPQSHTQSIRVVDINGDNETEILTGSRDDTLRIINKSGSTISTILPPIGEFGNTYSWIGPIVSRSHGIAVSDVDPTTNSLKVAVGYQDAGWMIFETSPKCTISFDDGADIDMYYNRTSKLYYFNNSFSTVGSHNWNTTCTGKNYASQTTTGSLIVGNVIPTVDSVVVNTTDVSINASSENVTAHVVNGSDLNGDTLTYTHNWIVDGSSYETLILTFDANASGGGPNSTRDYSLYATNATLGNASFDPYEPIWIGGGGVIGGAMHFDGKTNPGGDGDFIALPDFDRLDDGGDQLTIDMWYKPNTTSGVHAVIEKSSSAGAYEIYQSSTTVNFRIRNSTGQVETLTSTGVLSAGTWTHIAVTYNGTHKVIYIDGEVNKVANKTGAMSTNTAWLGIGTIANTVGNGSGYFMNATLDELRFYNRSLSQEQIRAHANLDYNVTVSQETGGPQNWSVNVTANDGISDGVTVGSNLLAIFPDAGKVILFDPVNSSSSSNLTPTFQWFNATRADSTDTLTYFLEVATDKSFSDPLTVNIDSVAEGSNGAGSNITNYTLTSELDRDIEYFWRVRATTGVENGSFSDPFVYNTTTLVAISLNVSGVNFVELDNEETNDTRDDIPPPFVIQNDGNVKVNVTVNSTSLWGSVGLDTFYYQFNTSYRWEGLSFDTSCSNTTTFINMLATPYTTSCMLNYTDPDTAILDLNITVPPQETGGSKSAIVRFEATG